MIERNATTKRMRTSLWIVDLLTTHKALTLKEINEYWTSADLSDGVPFERRTFYNYLLSIGSLLKVDIECDKRDGFRYKIVGRYDDRQAAKWLMQSYAASEAVANSMDISDRVLLEDIPSGQEHLTPLLSAIRTNRKITFEYQRFKEGTSHIVKDAEPYCMKLYQQRWYVLVKEKRTLLVSHDKIEEMHVYSLDRIKSLEVTDVGFEIDPLFDAKEYFRYAFGTRVEKDNPPYKVRLKVEASQAPYFRTLPLHHSQNEIETNDEYSIFELNVALTIELYFQILHYGHFIEVLEPEELVDVIYGEVRRMAENYGIVEPASPEEMEAWLEDVRKNNPELLEKKFSQDVYAGLK